MLDATSGSLFDALSRTDVLLLVGVLLLMIGLLAWFHMRKGNTYSALDLFLDHTTKKASLDSHITLFFAVLAAWYIVMRALGHATVDVGGDLISILGIFVLYRGVKQGIQAYSDKPTEPAPAEGDTVEQQVNIVTPKAPAIPALKTLKAKGR